MGKTIHPEVVENFGDVCKITYDTQAKQMTCVGRLSPTDISRLLEKIADCYSATKKKQGKRICELASELAPLLKKDCSFFADTISLVAPGNTILLEPDRKVITSESEY